MQLWKMKSSESLWYSREWKLIYLNLHLATRSRICRWSLTYLISSKEVSGKACKIWLQLRLHKDMATFQTLLIWIGHNATCYHNLNVLPHTSLYIFSEICLVLSYLQRVTIIFLKILIYIYIYKFFYKCDGNALEIAPNHAKLRENIW